MALPTTPVVFFKLPTAIIGPGEPIVLPKNSTEPDYEAEFAFVIGKGGYRIAADQTGAITSTATPSSTTSAPATCSSPPRSGP